MSAPNLTDLRARMDAVKKAPMLTKAAAAETALESFMQYLAVQDARITALEKGATHAEVQS